LAVLRKIARHAATKNFLAPLLQTRLSGDDYSGLLANHIAKGRELSRAVIARFGHIEDPALSAADPPPRAVIGG
jgi:hypothetical protein